MKIFAAIFLFVLCAVMPAAAQKTISLQDVKATDLYTSVEDKFSISLPEAAVQKKVTAAGEMGPGASGRLYSWRFPEAYFQVGIATFSKFIITTDKDYDHLVANQKEQLSADPRNKIDGQTRISLGDFKGVETLITMTDGTKSVVRCYAVGKQLYNLIVLFPPDDDVKAAAMRAADSLKITAEPPPIVIVPVKKN